MVSLLEGNNLAKVLAEPTLVTLSGQEARFLAGGELPIPLAALRSRAGRVEEVRDPAPVHADRDRRETIDLELRRRSANRSDLAVTIGGTTIPGLTSRQSETTIRLGDGQSFAIAGLISDRVRSQIDKVPVLGSIPILGAAVPLDVSSSANETRAPRGRDGAAREAGRAPRAAAAPDRVRDPTTPATSRCSCSGARATREEPASRQRSSPACGRHGVRAAERT